jgi:hypothetical protein
LDRWRGGKGAWGRGGRNVRGQQEANLELGEFQAITVDAKGHMDIIMNKGFLLEGKAMVF